MKAEHRTTMKGPAAPAPDMDTIEKRAKAYADARADLAALVSLAEAEIGTVRRKHLAEIRRRVGEAAAAEADLHAAVAARRDLFVRPKTRILHGIRLGWVKNKGRVTYADPARVVKAIRRHMPRRFKDLVKVTETPIKAALNKLPGADLRKLGVSVGDDDDAVSIAPVDSAVDRIVEALLAGAKDDPGEGEAA